MASDDSRRAGRYAAASHRGTYDPRHHREDGDTGQGQDRCADAPDVQARRRLHITGRRGKEKLFRPGAHRQGPDGSLTRVSSPRGRRVGTAQDGYAKYDDLEIHKRVRASFLPGRNSTVQEKLE